MLIFLRISLIYLSSAAPIFLCWTGGTQAHHLSPPYEYPNVHKLCDYWQHGYPYYSKAHCPSCPSLDLRQEDFLCTHAAPNSLTSRPISQIPHLRQTSSSFPILELKVALSTMFLQPNLELFLLSLGLTLTITSPSNLPCRFSAGIQKQLLSFLGCSLVAVRVFRLFFPLFPSDSSSFQTSPSPHNMLLQIYYSCGRLNSNDRDPIHLLLLLV